MMMDGHCLYFYQLDFFQSQTSFPDPDNIFAPSSTYYTILQFCIFLTIDIIFMHTFAWGQHYYFLLIFSLTYLYIFFACIFSDLLHDILTILFLCMSTLTFAFCQFVLTNISISLWITTSPHLPCVSNFMLLSSVSSCKILLNLHLCPIIYLSLQNRS